MTDFKGLVDKKFLGIFKDFALKFFLTFAHFLIMRCNYCHRLFALLDCMEFVSTLIHCNNCNK